MTFLLSVVLVAALSTQTGSWVMTPARSDATVRMAYHFENPDGSQNEQDDSVTTLAALGLTAAQVDGGPTHVTFAQTHDAGGFAFDGSVDHRQGTGSVTFTPSEAYASAMATRGYGTLTIHDLLVAALLDINLRYVDDLASAGYPQLGIRDLITFAALKIDPSYVRSMRAEFGGAPIDARDIVSLRAVGVTPDYLAAIRSAGLTADTPRSAIELRALKIDAAYVRDLAAAGYPNLTSKQVVEFKALQIDAAYIQRVHDHGLHPTVEQLVQLKAMNVI